MDRDSRTIHSESATLRPRAPDPAPPTCASETPCPSRGSPRVFNTTPILGRCARSQLVCPIPAKRPSWLKATTTSPRTPFGASSSWPPIKGRRVLGKAKQPTTISWSEETRTQAQLGTTPRPNQPPMRSRTEWRSGGASRSRTDRRAARACERSHPRALQRLARGFESPWVRPEPSLPRPAGGLRRVGGSMPARRRTPWRL